MKNSAKIRLFAVWIVILIVHSNYGRAQQVHFFTEGTDQTYYDQGIVDVANLGASTFEHTNPPGLPQYNDKVPCSATAYKGLSSLKFSYTSAVSGSWKVSIHRSGWTTADITGLDSLSFYIYSGTELPNTALPLIGLKAVKKSGSAEVSSKLYKLADYNNNVQPGRWNRVKFPLSAIVSDSQNDELDYTAVKGIIFGQSESNNSSRLIFIDDIAAFKSISNVQPVETFSATGYDSHAELNWQHPAIGLSYRVYASFDRGQTFELRGETAENHYLDFVPENGRNTTVTYRIVAVTQEKESDPNEKTATIRDFSDDELLDLMQRYTFRYFWEGAHQGSGMALERTNGSGSTVASGATGMGLMAMIVAHERQYQPREEVRSRILKILYFLENCERHHGAWSHWYNANTLRTQPFSADDDGGDLVETSFVAQALVALKNYFSGTDDQSAQIRVKSEKLWKEIDWNWYRQNGQNTLYWHWSPNFNFSKNMKITGWNESLITYIMAAASPTHGISKDVYTQGWARNGNMVNKRTFYNHQISLSPDWGGPLFWLHYTHLGINPHGLKDQYADYWQECVNTAKIHHAYAVANPLNRKNYSEKCWGLTASDDPYGYTAHQPMSNDNGTISPTAALASMPYTPEESMKALKYFYRERGKDLFGKFGPYDAFNDDVNWVKKAWLGIDQGPIVVMIENYRTKLLWNAVMKDPDVKAGLDKLGFQYEITTSTGKLPNPQSFTLSPNPGKGTVRASFSGMNPGQPLVIKVVSMDGRMVWSEKLTEFGNEFSFDCSAWPNGLYVVLLVNGTKQVQAKLLVQN